jgi:transcriptional regulator with XRE-family HTH domain
MRPAHAARVRLRSQMQRLGIEARTARMGLGWTQAVLAARAGVSQASVSRLEAGDTQLTITIPNAVFGALGMHLSARVYPAEGISLRDSGQIALAEILRQHAHPTWTVTLEEPIGNGSMQAADMLLDNGVAGLDVELESNLADFQAQLRGGHLKRAALQERLGHPLAFVLALRDTERNRAAFAGHIGVIRAALPASSREIMEAIRDGQPLTRDGLLWLRPRRRWS